MRERYEPVGEGRVIQKLPTLKTPTPTIPTPNCPGRGPTAESWRCWELGVDFFRSCFTASASERPVLPWTPDGERQPFLARGGRHGPVRRTLAIDEERHALPPVADRRMIAPHLAVVPCGIGDGKRCPGPLVVGLEVQREVEDLTIERQAAEVLIRIA